MEEKENEDLFDRVHEDLNKRRKRSLSGKPNCIPFGLPRFEEEVPGIEQGNYYIITANSKVGRQICPIAA